MRRIIDLEREGKVHSEILKIIIEALELDQDKVDELIHLDKEKLEQAFEEWVNEHFDNYHYTLSTTAKYNTEHLN